MEAVIGKKGKTLSHQGDFPEATLCLCGGVSEIAFVAYEGSEEEQYVHNLSVAEFSDETGNLWPHDAIAVAIYICRKCMKPVAILNQA